MYNNRENTRIKVSICGQLVICKHLQSNTKKKQHKTAKKIAYPPINSNISIDIQGTVSGNQDILFVNNQKCKVPILYL